MTTPPHELTATEAAHLIRSREISPVELVDSALERIADRNADLTAFVHLAPDEARAAARSAEAAVMSGEPLGPLHGVPTAIKDLYDFKPGWPSTFGGIPALRDNIVDHSCLFTERIEQAGAIVLGKTNSPFMGMRGTCDNPLFGPSRNPFDLTKNTGGSSGGSAAAVADGLVAFAEGTDAGGSIRIPAAWCGVYGLKGSWGRVPAPIRPNAFGGTSPFVAEGPISRTVADAALVMSVLSGPHAADPYSIDHRDDPLDGLTGDLTGARIAYSPDFGVYPVDRRVADVVDRAVTAFERAGATVDTVEFDLPYDHLELADLWCRMIAPNNIATLEGFAEMGVDVLGDHRDDIPARYLERIEAGARLSVSDQIRDQRMRTVVYDAVTSVFENHDFLVTPTVAAVQVDNHDDHDTVGPAEIDGVAVERLIGWCMTYFLNFTGHPAASIPAGMIDGRLPVGMQIIGNRYDDVGVIRASHVFEQLSPWADTYRLCWDR